MCSFAVAAALLISSTSLGGDVPRDTGVGDVVIATIKSVPERLATNGKPPAIVIEVHEVLRGNAKLDRSQAIVEPAFHGIDYGDVKKDPNFLRWQAAPLVPPKPGTKWVMWGKLVPVDPKNPDGPARFHLNPYHRYEFSDKRRQWATDDIKAQAAQRRAEEELRAAEERRRKILDIGKTGDQVERVSGPASAGTRKMLPESEK
jgi:hypothetical protein